MMLDNQQLAAIERARRRLAELRDAGENRHRALNELEQEYEEVRARIDALVGRERHVPAYRHDPEPLPPNLAASVRDTLRSARRPSQSDQ